MEKDKKKEGEERRERGREREGRGNLLQCLKGDRQRHVALVLVSWPLLLLARAAVLSSV